MRAPLRRGRHYTNRVRLAPPPPLGSRMRSRHRWPGALILSFLLPATPGAASAPQDEITLSVAAGGTPGAVSLTWRSGDGGPYAIYRSTSGPPEGSEANVVGTTDALSWSDDPPGGPILYYSVLPGPFWKRDISTAPVDPASSGIIASLAAAGGFGNGRLQIDFSINVLTADASVPFQSFTPTA